MIILLSNASKNKKRKEYEKNVKDLRNKVSSLQKERNQLLETVSDQRQKARKIRLLCQ